MMMLVNSIAHADCSSITPHTISADRYSLLNNGSEVLDKQTKLIWQRCLDGQAWSGSQCTGTPSSKVWRSALISAKDTTLWRIPNVKELESLTEYACHPMLDVVFVDINPKINYATWTSTPNSHNAQEAWVVNFSAYSAEIVAVSAKTYVYPTRFVRNAP